MNNTHPNRHPASVSTRDAFELLTEDELIALLAISRRTIRNWRHKRKLPYYRIGNSILYERTALLSFISRYKRSPRV